METMTDKDIAWMFGIIMGVLSGMCIAVVYLAVSLDSRIDKLISELCTIKQILLDEPPDEINFDWDNIDDGEVQKWN